MAVRLEHPAQQPADGAVVVSEENRGAGANTAKVAPAPDGASGLNFAFVAPIT